MTKFQINFYLYNMNFDNYKFRCSSLGKIMTNPRNKKDILSQTAKSYLMEVFIKEVYGREKDIYSEEMEKGNYTEQDSLTLIQHYYNDGLILKNQETIENEYITGTPDIVLEDRIVDAKSSWDIFTFFNADGSNKDYEWQLKGYMSLKDKRKADLCYCLNNTPEWMIVSEKTRQMYRRHIEDGSQEMMDMEAKIDKLMIYDDIPENQRIKVFSFELTDEDIENMKTKITEARKYLNQLLSNLK